MLVSKMTETISVSKETSKLEDSAKPSDPVSDTSSTTSSSEVDSRRTLGTAGISFEEDQEQEQDCEIEADDTGAVTTTTTTDATQEESRDHQDRPNKPNSKGNWVTFGALEIREYPITIGDNPGGNRGPPLTISWEYQSTAVMDVSEYETLKPDRRSGGEIIIPVSVRENMLREAGFSRGEIQAAVKHVNIARNRRRRTEELLNLSRLQEFAEKVKRGTMNSVVRRGRKKREREYIRHALEFDHKLPQSVVRSLEFTEEDDHHGDEDKNDEEDCNDEDNKE